MVQPFSPNWNESNFLQVNHSQSQALTPSRDRSNRKSTSCQWRIPEVFNDLDFVRLISWVLRYLQFNR